MAALLTDSKNYTTANPVIPPTVKPPVTPTVPTSTAVPASIGTYKGINITPGDQNSVDAQIAAINARQQATPTVTTTPPAAPTSPTTSTSPSTPQVDANQLKLSTQQSAYDSGIQQTQDSAKQFSDTITSIQNGSIPLSPGEQAQVAALQQSYTDAIGLQQLQNTNSTGVANIRGYQTGSAEYDPTFQAKTIGAIASAGAAKVLALQVAEAGAVAKLTQDLKDQNIAAVKESYDALTAAQDKRQTALQTMIKDTQDAIQTAQAAKQKILDGVNAIAVEAAKNGASKNTVAAITASDTVSGAIAAAGDTLQTATGQLGDYLQYKRDAEASGLVPESYATWKAADDAKSASQKASEAYGVAFATAKGGAAGEGGNGGTQITSPVTSPIGITYNAPASIAPYVAFSANGVKYVDMSSFKGTPTEAHTAVMDAQAAGYKVITNKNTALDIQNITDAVSKLDNMKAAFDNITSGSAAQRDLYGVAFTKMASALQTDPNVVASNVYEDAALDVLKAMSGVQGFRGGASMVQKVQSTFPAATDTKQVADAKIATLKQLIGDRENALVGKPSTNDQMLLDQKTKENNLTDNLTSIKTSDPKLYIAASNMFLSVDPDTGQPYTAADILQAFPELSQ